LGRSWRAKYEYQPLARHPENADEEEVVREEGAAPTNPFYRPPFTKVRLDLAFDSDKPNFRLFDKSSGTRKEVQLNTFDDVLQHMRFLTKHRMAIQFSKLYAMKTASGGEEEIRDHPESLRGRVLQQVQSQEGGQEHRPFF